MKRVFLNKTLQDRLLLEDVTSLMRNPMMGLDEQALKTFEVFIEFLSNRFNYNQSEPQYWIHEKDYLMLIHYVMICRDAVKGNDIETVKAFLNRSDDLIEQFKKVYGDMTKEQITKLFNRL